MSLALSYQVQVLAGSVVAGWCVYAAWLDWEAEGRVRILGHLLAFSGIRPRAGLGLGGSMEGMLKMPHLVAGRPSWAEGLLMGSVLQ